MRHYLNYNGKFHKEDKPVITAGNRSFRYGDGVFETMKVINGNIELASFHFERLFTAMNLLKFENPNYLTPEFLTTQVSELCRKNHHKNITRVRLVIFRGNGGLYDPENHFPNYIIQSWQLLDSNNSLNENGFIIDVYPYAKKSIDSFSNLKSNNFLPYIMGALYAKQQKLNDSLILNSNATICDSTIANIFIIKGNCVFTPPLSDGCVAGVMRRHLLEKLASMGFEQEERSLDIDIIMKADEVFLTNSIYGIRWVKEFRDVQYGHTHISQIYNTLFKNQP